MISLAAAEVSERVKLAAGHYGLQNPQQFRQLVVSL